MCVGKVNFVCYLGWIVVGFFVVEEVVVGLGCVFDFIKVLEGV